VGLVGALLLILVIWLGIRSVIKRTAPAVAQARLSTWTDRSASVLALVLIGGTLWHVIAVATINRLPRQDVDGSPVYERMDAINKR
jgi:cell division protein FtsX